MERVSVVIPCRNEAAFIEACLTSVLSNRFPADRLEVLVVDGMSTDGTRDIVLDVARHHAAVRLIDNPEGVTPVALNRGIRAATGSVIMRMDAHAVYHEHYIVRCVEALERYGADNVGGVMHTVPRREGLMGRAIAAALSHRFGVGDSAFRVHPPEPRFVDTVFGGCYRREVFDRVGLFNERLARGQDLEFNLRLKRAGGRTMLVPDIECTYYARADFPAFLRHNFQNGVWAVLPFRHSNVIPVQWKHLAPLAFVASLGTAALAAALGSGWAMRAMLAIVMIYAGLALVASAGVARRHRDWRLLAVMPIVFGGLHLSYGLGSLWGLIRILTGTAAERRASVESTSD